MRIGFLVGRADMLDGITSYTVRLAAQLRKMNHQTAVMACNDTQENDFVVKGQSPIRFNVISNRGSLEHRADTLKRWIEDQKLDAVSIQFNCHHLGNQKGIIAPFIALGKRALRDVPIQVFFHELWYNAYQEYSLSNWLKGIIRRHYVVQMIKVLRPQWAMTNTAEYAKKLGRLGLDAHLVPIFSTISKLHGESSIEITKRKMSAVIFGTLPPHWHGESLIRELHMLASTAGCELEVVGIGRHGYGDQGWNRLRDLASPDVSFKKIGSCDDEMISRQLASADVGISVTDLKHWTKSTTLAAMLEHALPIAFEVRRTLRIGGSRESLRKLRERFDLGDLIKGFDMDCTDVSDVAGRYHKQLTHR